MSDDEIILGEEDIEDDDLPEVGDEAEDEFEDDAPLDEEDELDDEDNDVDELDIAWRDDD